MTYPDTYESSDTDLYTSNKNCKIVADSYNNANEQRLVTILFKRFPYALLQEPATHRIMTAVSINPFTEFASRNSNSTRAIPIKKIIEKVKADPYIPTFEKANKGMSGLPLDYDVEDFQKARDMWLDEMNHAIRKVEEYDELSIHKSKPSKLLTPYLRIQILVTATNWNNFFDLRCNSSADNDFRDQAQDALDLYNKHQPTVLEPGEWHIPYDEDENRDSLGIDTLKDRLLHASANVARISYLDFYNRKSLESNLDLAVDLINDNHWSPFEASAVAIKDNLQVRNFTGFLQLRFFLENGLSF